MIYAVATPSPLRKLFDYLPPADESTEIRPGSRVRVPFGRRSVVGLVVARKTDSSHDNSKLRAIEAVLDRAPLLPDHLFELFLWAARYYQHPVGDALFSTLPALLRAGEAIPENRREHWRLTTLGKGLAETSLSRAPKQQAVIRRLAEAQNGVTTEVLTAEDIRRETLRTLRGKGLVEPVMLAVDGPDETGATSEDPAPGEAPLELRPEQVDALAAVEPGRFRASLLFGDTGSGKTEVYLQAIERVLRRGEQALVLVPEINLTPQTLRRFRQRFRCGVTALHSGLTDRERLQSWADARAGRTGIVIGTRSAVFTPLARPGMIVVDEEHDGSYKQQDGFRYSARDVAVMRASREGIPVILGSATPALETLHNCHQGRYQLLELRQRAREQTPRWELLDIRGSQLDHGFSAPLLTAMEKELAGGNQVLVFVNRRGYAPLMLCHQCGWMAECRRCSARMTAHRDAGRLICHHCEWQKPLPRDCPDCHSGDLRLVGQGTERSEELLRSLFPEHRVLRIDRDTVRRKTAMEELVEEIRRGDPCILVGTQMLAKGHHFPAVTLAVLLDVDGGLFSTDFRATERMGQLITQVAGRAGRGHRPGRVLIQSHHCDHPLLEELVERGYRGFAERLLAERRLSHTPPYTNLALLRAEAREGSAAVQFLERARRACEARLQPSSSVRYLGPLPAAMEKRNNYYRFLVSIFADDRQALGSALDDLCRELEQDRRSRQVRWAVDVDPQESL